MKQTVPLTGEVLRGPKPAPVAVPHTALTGDPAVDGPILLAHYHATKAEQDKVDSEWPLELNHKPPDPIMKSILLGHVQESPNTAISKIYADALERPDWSWTTIYDKIKIVADNLNDGLESNGRGPHTPSSSRGSSTTTSPSDSSTASLICQIKELQRSQSTGNQPKKCKNCNGPHDSWDCPSKKCHFPGCTVGTFATAEARKQHYVETHARPRGANGGRGDREGGRSERGGRSGRAGRSGGRGSTTELSQSTATED